MKKIKYLLGLMAVVSLLISTMVTAFAATNTSYSDPKGTMSGIPGVSFATSNGDWNGATVEAENAGKTFTTDKGISAGSFNSHDYQEGEYITISSNQDKRIRALKTGEHYYSVPSSDDEIFYVGKWTMKWYPAQCIHGGVSSEDYWRGLVYNDRKCGQFYNQITRGWMPICAKCGKELYGLFYMSPQTAKTFTHMQVGYVYYYLCPFNNNLEVSIDIKHDCSDISNNMYEIKYDKNFRTAKGYMANSVHYYDNATIYEGKTVTPQTKFSKNNFSRTGYVFTNWATNSDGTGTTYADEQEILNLTAEDKKIIRVYAQWRKSKSTLQLDLDGGKYDGNSSFSKVGEYNDKYELKPDLITPPAGPVITFLNPDNTVMEKKTVAKEFFAWLTPENMKGDLQTNTYTYGSTDGAVDIVKTSYRNLPIILPDPPASPNGEGFIGWFEEGEEEPVGKAGDEVIFNEPTTLYPKYARLVLQSQDDYESNNKKGAVDLNWFMQETN